ncbi:MULTISPECIES: VOC family protein [Thalassospira]|uniref:VOC family protein n=1 Tax=Thalassospira aquimaris TaxID=3037796 RepID=A0ABT6G7J9_9PROT|nr:MULTISPECIES: VOC family protein [Thalassospira]MDG4718028.1 VOC family protein [Thalassospira sp. FZY0004]
MTSAKRPDPLPVTGPCNRLVIYCKKIDAMVAFYCDHFGYQQFTDENDRIIELRPRAGGVILMLHPAGKGQKEGQSLIKLVFDVADVTAVRASLIKAGLDVGPIHDAGTYQFANLKDPAKNSVSISSRAFSVQ